MLQLKDNIVEELKCHICNRSTDYCCESCDKPVCDKCTELFTLYDQLEGNYCKNCNELAQMMASAFNQPECNKL